MPPVTASGEPDLDAALEPADEGCCGDPEVKSGTGGQTVTVNDVRDLASRCWIDFGRVDVNPGWTFRMKVCIPPEYQSTTSKSEMLSEFCPEWVAVRSDDWEGLHANIVSHTQAKVFGLFWDDGWGFTHRAVLYALNMIASVRLEDCPLFDHINESCAYDDFRGTGKGMAETIAAGKLPIGIEASGVFTGVPFQTITHRDNGFVECARVLEGGIYATIVNPGAIALFEPMRLHAALADYYFWWAWRCHSYFVEFGSFDHYLTGRAAARAALAEISAIAGYIVHEAGHWAGFKWAHCQDRFIVGISANSCCMEVARFAYLQWSGRQLGLPYPALVSFRVGSWEREGHKDRFRGYKEPTMELCGKNPIGEHGDCSAQAPDGWSAVWHGEAFDSGRGVTLTWCYPELCDDIWNGDEDSPAVSFTDTW